MWSDVPKNAADGNSKPMITVSDTVMHISGPKCMTAYTNSDLIGGGRLCRSGVGLWWVEGVSPGFSTRVDAVWWVEFWLAVGDGAFPLGVVDESVVSATE